jgi:hypothetical protein
MLRVLASLLVFEGLVLAQPTPDQAARAKQLFEEGRTDAAAGKSEEACTKFSASFALDPAVGTELNLGDCQEKLGHLSVAWHLFDDAAKKDNDADRIKYARGRATTLAPKLAALIIKLPDPSIVGLTVKVEGNPVPPAAEITTMVDPGDQVVEVSVPGGPTETRPVHASAGQTVTVDFGAPPTVHHDEPPPPVPAGPEGPEPVRRHSRVVMGEAIMGVGGAALVTGVVLGLVARSHYDSAFPTHCTNMSKPMCDPTGFTTTSDAITLANVGTVVGVVGIAGVVAGALVWYTAPKDIVVTPTASGQGAGISVSGTF